MKRKYIRLFAIIGLLAMPAFSQTNVGGVELKDELIMDGEKLILNGAGLRKKFFIKLYAGALYLAQKESSASAIINGDQPMMIQLNFMYGISGQQMIEALIEGFTASTDSNTGPIQNEIDLMIGSLSDKFNKGDTLELIYLPETGVKVYHNGKVGATVNGFEFKKALFGIWLGSTPVLQELNTLKAAMLGN